jgi:hypothetical protein
MIHKLYVAAAACALWATSAQAQFSNLTSYVSKDGGEHVVYEDGASQHIHQVWYDANNNWTNQDLTSLTGAPLAATGSALTSLVTSNGSTGNQQHIFFLDTNGTVFQFLYDGSTWTVSGGNNLGQSTQAASGSSLTSWTNCGGEQHVAFLDGNSHVHMLYYNGSWSDTDLTSLTGATPAVSGSPLTSYLSKDCNDHIDYLGSGVSPGINAFYYSSGWHRQQLLGNPDSNTRLTSFNDCHGEHVVGEVNTSIFQMYYNGSWRFQSLGGNPASGAPLTSFAGASCDEHIFYIDGTSQNHIHQLYYNGSWHSEDLSGLANALPAWPGTLTSFDDSRGQHVVYWDNGGRIDQLYYSGSWVFQVIKP